MNDLMLVRYGDLLLKGKNLKYFTRTVNQLIQEKLEGLAVDYDFRHDRAYLMLNDVNPIEVTKRLAYVTGVYSFSLVSKTSVDYDAIADVSVMLIEAKLQGKAASFKVETKRADKDIPITSMEISKLVSGKILRKIPLLTVDVHHPDIQLDIEIRKDGAYVFIDEIKGIGGYPVPMGGKAIVLLSGGIDSPVAGFLAMKKGIEIECVHFESTPMTSIESVQKVIDLTAVLARYHPQNSIKLHLVPFLALHELLIKMVPESYLITIMRRMMLRIATIIESNVQAKAIVTGDSIGQVASQTLESMNAIQHVTKSLIIRPLASFDKLDIMNLAREIETLAISNRPFSDCCSVYVPKNPSIRPEAFFAEKFEFKLPYQALIDDIVSKVVTLNVNADNQVDIRKNGLTVAEAIQ